MGAYGVRARVSPDKPEDALFTRFDGGERGAGFFHWPSTTPPKRPISCEALPRSSERAPAIEELENDKRATQVHP